MTPQRKIASPSAPMRYVALRTFVPELTPLRRRMLVRRARMHLQTARWLAELRADWRWETACRAAMATLSHLEGAPAERSART
jgi:hypothetical protein